MWTVPFSSTRCCVMVRPKSQKLKKAGTYTDESISVGETEKGEKIRDVPDLVAPEQCVSVRQNALCHIKIETERTTAELSSSLYLHNCSVTVEDPVCLLAQIANGSQRGPK